MKERPATSADVYSTPLLCGMVALMMVGAPQTPHALYLEVQGRRGDDEDFQLSLRDDQGHTVGGSATLDLQRPFHKGTSWQRFLSDYLKGEVQDEHLAAFGKDLFQCLITNAGLGPTWQAVQASAGKQPLHLTVEFGAHTQALAELPLELLHDGQSFLFSYPGASLVRTFLITEAVEPRTLEPLASPRVLFAWACPAGAGHPFDPQPHLDALQQLFGDRVHCLERASLNALGEQLSRAQTAGAPFDYVHLLAHGYGNTELGGLCLHREDGELDRVDGGRLAHVLRGKGLRFAFLCSCRSAVTGPGAFAGVAQQLLAPRGGDLPWVVATQANLPIRGSAELARRFYHHLKHGPPGEALAHARCGAYGGGGPAWSVPVLLTCPVARSQARPAPASELLTRVPQRSATYQARPELHAEVLQALKAAPLVSIVGLPGIGKTELGCEAARLAGGELVDRVIYLEAHLGAGTELVRLQVAQALGLTQLPESDDEVAVALAQDSRRTLLVIDNAEDLMREPEAQEALHVQLERWRQVAPRLKVLLTTRWPLGGERTVHVPPMKREEMDVLFAAELEHLKVLREGWRGSAAWERLLELMDGHPRTLALLSRQFTVQGTSLEEVLRQLEHHREGAIVEAELLGQKRAFEALTGEARARLKSLVATMELSYEVVQKQYPEAAEAFLALSFFPAGLPEKVAYEVAGGVESMALKHLQRMHMVEWHDERTFYPVPLHWYAERKRKAAALDEVAAHRRALAAFAEFVQHCDGRVLSGDIVSGTRRLLAEERTLVQLAEWVGLHGETGGAESALAWIAIAADNTLDLAARYHARRMLLDGGLQSAEKLADQSGRAGCLLCLGNLALRVDDLEGARRAYEQALPLFREIRERLGEANCLQSLGDLARREADLEGARRAYEQALPLFREIRERLGEANCLQGLGQLALAQGEVQPAFLRFLEVLQRFRELEEQLGQQAAHGYLARTAAAAGALDQALLLAEASLDIGRRVQDRFGQTITLELQMQVFAQQKDVRGLLATARILRELYASLGNAAQVARLQQLLGALPAELANMPDPEALRQAAIAVARQRFQQEGRDLYEPPPVTKR